MDRGGTAMGKHSPKGQIVRKKEEKLAAVAAALPADCPDENFAKKFKEMYPEDWEKIVQRYKEHERATPAGKAHPMAPPPKYLLNMVKGYRTKANKPEDKR